MDDPEARAAVNPILENGLPALMPLCDLQAAVASAYADVLSLVTKRLGETKGARAQGLGIVLDRLRHDAFWAVTEVRSSAEFKIRRQRYVSQDVFGHWQMLCKQPKPTLGSFAKDANGATLCHEHVIQRRGMSQRINSMASAHDLFEELSKATSCIVSRAEHGRLSAVKAGDGWERYASAQPPVGVYDRKLCKWVIERC